MSTSSPGLFVSGFSLLSTSSPGLLVSGFSVCVPSSDVDGLLSNAANTPSQYLTSPFATLKLAFLSCNAFWASSRAACASFNLSEACSNATTYSSSLAAKASKSCNLALSVKYVSLAVS